MSPSHGYGPIKENEDLKDEIRDGLLDTTEARKTPWMKYLLFVVLAASAGFGAAVGVVFANSYLKHNGSTSVSEVASPTAPAGLIATASAAADAIPTTAVKDKEDEDEDDVDYIIVDEPEEILECGWSTEDAKAHGCVYDVMMQDWVPEQCYDPLLTERYLASGNYTWYRDSEGHVMTDEEMRKGEHGEAWMSADYHKAHCIFSWEKLIRALRTNNYISQELLSYDHVLHCRMQTLGGDHMKRDEGIGVKAPTNYAKCARYNTWRNDFIPDKHSSIEK